VLGEAVVRLGADTGGLLTLYYGGTQKEREAERLTQALRERMPKVEIEWFFGGQRTSEYVVGFER
jgi:dihydroxyacetone kinase-like predicted kinase